MQSNARGKDTKIAHRKKKKGKRHMSRTTGDNGKSTRKHISIAIFSRADGVFRLQVRNEANPRKPLVAQEGAPCPLVIHTVKAGSSCKLTPLMRAGIFNEFGVSDTGIEVCSNQAIVVGCLHSLTSFCARRLLPNPAGV